MPDSRSLELHRIHGHPFGGTPNQARFASNRPFGRPVWPQPIKLCRSHAPDNARPPQVHQRAPCIRLATSCSSRSANRTRRFCSHPRRICSADVPRERVRKRIEVRWNSIPSTAKAASGVQIRPRSQPLCNAGSATWHHHKHVWRFSNTAPKRCGNASNGSKAGVSPTRLKYTNGSAEISSPPFRGPATAAKRARVA